MSLRNGLYDMEKRKLIPLLLLLLLLLNLYMYTLLKSPKAS
jgi:hypothetical protein